MRPIFVMIKCEMGQAYRVAREMADTIVPLELYWSQGKVKLEIGVGSTWMRRAPTAMRWPTRMVPLRIRPTAMRPTYSFAERLVTSSWSGCSGVYVGDGVTSTSRSRRSAPRPALPAS